MFPLSLSVLTPLELSCLQFHCKQNSVLGPLTSVNSEGYSSP